jgi:hypothetical protein
MVTSSKNSSTVNLPQAAPTGDLSDIPDFLRRNPDNSLMLSGCENPPAPLTLADLAVRIKAEHEAAASAMQRSVEHAINVGELLIQAKALLKHGQWLPWLEEHCAMPERTAQFYMRVARHRKIVEAEGKYARLADLTLEGVQKLLAAPLDDGESEKKARKPPNYKRAKIFREMKLGSETLEKIKGTSLDNSRELDELIVLNRGAEEGGLTPTVQKLVKDAAAGKEVSALAHGRINSRRANPLIKAWKIATQEERLKFREFIADWLVENDRDAAEVGGAAEDDTVPPPRKGRKSKFEETELPKAVSDAFSALTELGNECREVVDNAPDGLSQTRRAATCAENAAAAADVRNTVHKSVCAALRDFARKK